MLSWEGQLLHKYQVNWHKKLNPATQLSTGTSVFLTTSKRHTLSPQESMKMWIASTSRVASPQSINITVPLKTQYYGSQKSYLFIAASQNLFPPRGYEAVPQSAHYNHLKRVCVLFSISSSSLKYNNRVNEQPVFKVHFMKKKGKFEFTKL